MGVDNEIFWSEIALGSPPRFPKNTPLGEEGKKKREEPVMQGMGGRKFRPTPVPPDNNTETFM